MDEREYVEWMAAHIKATGADASRLAEILAANRETICERWHATYAELCECSDRLVERGRVPAFPDKHTNALKAELDAIRAEDERHKKLRQVRAQYGDQVKGCDCPHCNGGTITPSYAAARALLHAAAQEGAT